MLTVYGKSSSINVRKVLWTCTELSLNYAHEQYGSGFKATTSAEFLQMNPNAMVPVIREHDAAELADSSEDFVLWESNSICRYLAAKHGRSDLLPDQPRPRAQVEKWMDWQAGELNNSWRYAFMALVRQSPAHSNPESIAEGVNNWNRHMAMLDAQLQTTAAYVTGEQFTLADVVLGLSVQRWIAAPIQRTQLPAVTAYYELLSQRPGFILHGRNGMP